MDFKRYLLLLLHHLAMDRANNRSFLISSISVEQKRSPHILPESRVFKNQSPHISPTTRGEIWCKVPMKSPYSPTSARGLPPRGSRWQVHKRQCPPLAILPPIFTFRFRFSLWPIPLSVLSSTNSLQIHLPFIPPTNRLPENKLPPSFVAKNSYFYKFVLRDAI